MTSFFLMQDKEGNLKASKVNPVSGTALSSIYFDGFYFWLGDIGFIHQVWVSPTFSFHTIRTWDITSIVGNVGSSKINCIVGDGKDLYAGFSYATGSPILTERFTILKIDKDMNVLHRFVSATRQAPEAEYSDLAYDGHCIYAPYANSTGGARILRLDVAADKSEVTTATTLPQSIDFDGLNFLANNGTAIQLMNREYDFMFQIGTSARSFTAVTQDGDWLIGVA